jgi:hypothetical protein
VTVLAFPVLVLALLVPKPAESTEVLVELNDIRADEILTVGFELPKAASVTVEALGIRSGYGRELAAYAWLLDHDTRDLVWVQERRYRDRHRTEEGRVTTEENLRLEAGKYELYLAAANRWSGDSWGEGDFESLSDVILGLKDAFSGKRNHAFERELRDCYVIVASDELSHREVKTFEVTGAFANALIQFNQVGDDEFLKQGFELTRAGRVHVYALVEVPGKTAVDRAWIMNAESHERVWETTRRNTDFAGGGDKNRLADEEIELAKGKYILYYATDDSHSWEYFNTLPPYDPLNWGVALLPGRDFQKSWYRAWEPPELGDPLIDLTRARDDDYLEQAFKVTRETQLHIRAVGEYSDWSDEFVDYGAIQDAATGNLVWEMTGRNTCHAGGADKNRGFEGAITLPKGQYVAFYTTDDSHSYRDWNSSQPYEPEAWGLAIYPGSGYRNGDLVKLSERDLSANSDILAQIVRVRDDEERQARFTLDKPTHVRIYALGEGSGGDMYDYGWIENRKTGRAVWEMTYRKTRHAGGADKNRVFDGEILLDAGEYEVFYVTDGSHSFNDWNADRPRNPRQWGITISMVKPES